MNILITRPYPEGKYLVKMLRSYGKQAWHLPLIYFTPGKDLIILNKLLQSLLHKDFICIVSPRAIYYANSQIVSEKLNWPKYVKYYAIGHTSAEYFTKVSGINVNYSKYGNTSENLIELLSQYNLKKKKCINFEGK